MAWRIEIEDKALKELTNLDPATQRRILRYLRERIADSDNPRALGTPLKGQLSEYWRYRIGNYRVICSIDDAEVTVLVIRQVRSGSVRAAGEILPAESHPAIHWQDDS